MTTNHHHATDAAPVCSCVTEFGTIGADLHEWLLGLEAGGMRAVVELFDWAEATFGGHNPHEVEPAPAPGLIHYSRLNDFFLAHADRLADVGAMEDLAGVLADFMFARDLQACACACEGECQLLPRRSIPGQGS